MTDLLSIPKYLFWTCCLFESLIITFFRGTFFLSPCLLAPFASSFLIKGTCTSKDVIPFEKMANKINFFSYKRKIQSRFSFFVSSTMYLLFLSISRYMLSFDSMHAFVTLADTSSVWLDVPSYISENLQNSAESWISDFCLKLFNFSRKRVFLLACYLGTSSIRIQLKSILPISKMYVVINHLKIRIGHPQQFHVYFHT